MLVNKFRNKFNVTTTTEGEIDRLILSKVQDLLKTGSANQAALQTVDEFLSKEIPRLRRGGKPTPPAESTKPVKTLASTTDMKMKATSDQKSEQAVARSNRSVEPLMQRSMRANDQPLNLHFEDPAAALNISDDRWNSMVQENLKKFEEDKVRAIQAKKAKNKAIQEEQLKQIQERRNRELSLREAERKEFNLKGISASDVYYVNQDKKDQAKAALRGASKDVAADLRNKHQMSIEVKQAEMKK